MGYQLYGTKAATRQSFGKPPRAEAAWPAGRLPTRSAIDSRHLYPCRGGARSPSGYASAADRALDPNPYRLGILCRRTARSSARSPVYRNTRRSLTKRVFGRHGAMKSPEHLLWNRPSRLHRDHGTDVHDPISDPLLSKESFEPPRIHRTFATTATGDQTCGTEQVRGGVERIPG